MLMGAIGQRLRRFGQRTLHDPDFVPAKAGGGIQAIARHAPHAPFSGKCDPFEAEVEFLGGFIGVDDGHGQELAVGRQGGDHIHRISRTAGVHFGLIGSHRIQRRRHRRVAADLHRNGAEVVPVELEEHPGGVERGFRSVVVDRARPHRVAGHLDEVRVAEHLLQHHRVRQGAFEIVPTAAAGVGPFVDHHRNSPGFERRNALQVFVVGLHLVAHPVRRTAGPFHQRLVNL